MSSVVKFSAVNSKVKALKGKMLKESEYLELLQAKGYENTLRVLKERTRYGEILKDYDIEKLHRGQLEVILIRNYAKDFNKFINYFSGENRKVVKCLYLRWEIEDLKLIIRGKFIGRDRETIERKIVGKTALSTIDYESLLSAKNLDDLFERMKETLYYDHIKNLIKDISKKGLFRIETELDLVYFMTLRKELKRLDKENAELISEIMGAEADLINLSWIYRGRQFYQIPSDELFNYTVYDWNKLSKDKLKALCYASTMEDFKNIIDKTPYGFIYENPHPNIIERKEREFQKNYFSKILREGKMNFGSLIAYLVLNRIELKNIISIVEEKRYDMDIDECKKYISVTL